MNKVINSIKTIWKKGLIHILTGTFIIKLISFFGSIFLVRVLNKQDYGVLGYLENIYGYVFIFAGIGVSNAILRYVVLGKDRQEKYIFFSYAYKMGFFVNCILVIIAIVMCFFYPHPEVYQNSGWLLYILLLSLPFQYITDNVLCNERAMFANQRYAFFSLLLSASIIVGKIISGTLFGIVGVVFCQGATYFVMALFFLFSTKHKYYQDLKGGAIEAEQRKEMNVYSFQYMITNGLWAIFMLNDTFLLGRYCRPEILAEYKVAYTIPGSVTLISTAIGIFVAPYFVKNENDTDWIKYNFKRAYIINALFVGLVCVGIAVLSKPIIWILYGNQYLGISNIMRILLLAAFLNCGLRYTVANILAAMGKVKYNMIVSTIGILLQLGLNIKIVPVYGAVGVATTSCIVYGCMAIILLTVFIKQYYGR